jgi:hypothetical protein
MMQEVLPDQAKIRRSPHFVNQIAAGKHLDGIADTYWMVLVGLFSMFLGEVAESFKLG